MVENVSKVMVPLGQADLADRGVRWAAIQVRGIWSWWCFGGGGESQRNVCHVLDVYFRHILLAGLQIWIWFLFFPATNEKEGRLQLYLNLFCFFDVHTDFIFIVNKQRMED